MKVFIFSLTIALMVYTMGISIYNCFYTKTEHISG